jgi:signal transduction histidine kinase
LPNLADIAPRVAPLARSRPAVPLLYIEFAKNDGDKSSQDHGDDARRKRAIASALKRSLGTVLRKGDIAAAGTGAHWFVALLLARARRRRSQIVDADLGIAAERLRRAAQAGLGSSNEIGVRCGWSVLELDGSPPYAALRQAVRGAAVLARVEERRATVLAGITHELRTPLTAIIGFAERLKEGDLDTKRRARAIDIIIEEAQRLSRLAEGLIDIGAWTTGHLKVQRRWCDLKDIVEQAADALKQRAHKKGVRISIDAPQSVTAVDKDKCLQVLLNLLDNAVRHAPDGSVVEVKLRQTPAAHAIEIADRGHGFEPRVRRSLGRPFARGANGRAGLGLAISKVIVEAHGGKLSVSARTEGRVVVTLPRTGGPAA